MIGTDSRVLIADNQPRVRRLIESMFRASGVKTAHTVPDAASAKEVLLTIPIDVVLYDWNTPGENGIDFLRYLRSAGVTKFLPFVLMSGVGVLDDQDYAVGKDLDVDGYVFKPITHEDLEDNIGHVMDRHGQVTPSYVHLTRASAFVDIEEYDEARKELKSAREKGERSPRVWNESGLVYEDMSQDREAKLCYERSIRLDKGYAKPYNGIADVLTREGNPEEAHKFYEKAAEVSPRSSERQYALAKSLLEKGDTDGARVAVSRAVRGIQRDETAQTHQAENSAAAAEFYLATGFADMAEEELGFALQGDPNNVHYFNQLGMAFRRQKKYQEALTNYKKAIQVAPGDVVIYYNMAMAFVGLRNFQAASASLQKALTIDANFKDGENLLRKIQAEMKKQQNGNGHTNGHS
ncbi:MAG: tetratricopeptide repeat protein [Nitrospinaceae bacterium]|jgi:tetratricopeptide (TPR) repeat protein/FixJ family two-component response regulator|nr:tetratricopeptide repeat protein [Nitrospinaceae bacterium]MBT4092671.1 tetratricopeptide repeat protein [Nitrospinaceae bacterium]MBT4429931.1 tetratricopeptide repeat protein [Nitrospinaceae bacterium]MBT5369869.1 tetratricopeptide repeat protein [Nitrospinaceae bacterium]MBT5948986.1 tetratricopeptide repeat protein [Nitrospinaceae bacterium]